MQSVAAAVTAVLMRQEQEMAEARPSMVPTVSAGVPGTTIGACETQVLEDKLREARRAKWQRKRQRRRERAQTAAAPPVRSDVEAVAMAVTHSLSAGDPP